MVLFTCPSSVLLALNGRFFGGFHVEIQLITTDICFLLSGVRENSFMA